ncbi:MAG: ROK family protein [Syntrophobacteraceae bacterium]
MIKRGNIQSELNQYQVIRLLRTKGRITRPELVRTTGLSRPTIDKIVEFFKKERIISEAGSRNASSRSGRRPVDLSLDNSSKIIAGVDFECPGLEVVMTDLSSTIIDCMQRHYSPFAKKELIIDTLIQDIREMIGRQARSTNDLLGIGVALPGVVDVRNGMSLNIERLKDWNNVPVSQLLGKALKVPVFIDNDVNLMALAERNLGNLDMSENLIYVSLRQGIGAGILIDGQIFRGNYGNSGFLGHTSINPRGPKCKCGNLGCLELYAGENAIANMYMAKLRQARTAQGSRFHRLNAAAVYEAAARKDPTALAVLYEAGTTLGVGIANMICLFDVNHIVLWGKAVQAGESFFRGVGDSINRRLEPAFRTNMELGISTLNEHAAALGATLLVMEDLFGAPESHRYLPISVDPSTRDLSS